MTTTKEVELDSRGRAPLGRIATHQRYRLEKFEDGSILLTPVVSISQRELDFLSNPDLVASVRLGIAQAHAGQLKPYDPGPLVEDDED